MIIVKVEYMENQAYSNSQILRGFFVALHVKHYTKKNTGEEFKVFLTRSNLIDQSLER